MRRRQIWARAAETSPLSTPEPEMSLEDQYKAKFGKAPHHRKKRETIARELQDGDTC